MRLEEYGDEENRCGIALVCNQQNNFSLTLGYVLAIIKIMNSKYDTIKIFKTLLIIECNSTRTLKLWGQDEVNYSIYFTEIVFG